MNGPHLTVRAIRFFSSESVVDQEDPDDTDTNADVDNTDTDQPTEADGDLDFTPETDGDQGED